MGVKDTPLDNVDFFVAVPERCLGPVGLERIAEYARRFLLCLDLGHSLIADRCLHLFNDKKVEYAVCRVDGLDPIFFPSHNHLPCDIVFVSYDNLMALTSAPVD